MPHLQLVPRRPYLGKEACPETAHATRGAKNEAQRPYESLCSQERARRRCVPRRTHKQGTFPETTRHLLAPRVPTERLPFPLRRAVSARSSPCWARPEDNQSIQLVEPTVFFDAH